MEIMAKKDMIKPFNLLKGQPLLNALKISPSQMKTGNVSVVKINRFMI